MRVSRKLLEIPATVPSSTPTNRWLRVSQAVELFNVTEFWLRTQIRNGVLVPVLAGKRHLLDRFQVESLFEKLQQEETERRNVTKRRAAILLDEVGGASEEMLVAVPEFIINLTLKETGEFALDAPNFGERTADRVWAAYPILDKVCAEHGGIPVAPTPEEKKLFADAVLAERDRVASPVLKMTRDPIVQQILEMSDTVFNDLVGE